MSGILKAFSRRKIKVSLSCKSQTISIYDCSYISSYSMDGILLASKHDTSVDSVGNSLFGLA